MQFETGLQIKGIKDGLLITLTDEPWEALQADLLSQIESKVDFYKGARLMLDVGNRILHAAELGNLRDKLSDRGVVLSAVLSDSPTTEMTARLLGLGTKELKGKSSGNSPVRQLQVDGEDAIVIQRTLRSGFKVNSESHIIIIGDVNPGAEITSGGSIIVWGKLNGQVWAGKDGDLGASVCALDLSPNSIRIYDKLINALPKNKKGLPQMAILQDGKIEIQNWEKNTHHGS
jgi:septum site-determining protein MinC